MPPLVVKTKSSYLLVVSTKFRPPTGDNMTTKVTTCDRFIEVLDSFKPRDVEGEDVPMEFYLALRNSFPDNYVTIITGLVEVGHAYGEWTLTQLNDPECDGPG